mgnify:CR=1 FL=1
MVSKAAGLITILGGGVWLTDTPPPIVYVNEDNNLLSTWASESITGSDLPPDCNFWNQSVIFSAEMCSLFVVNRAAAAHKSATQRAMKCLAAHGSECILSPEIGLAMPAVFVYDYVLDSMQMMIAPKILPLESEQSHVRVSPPDSDGITQTRTMVFNNSVSVEYLDGQTKQLRSRILLNEEAYCVQLLRQSFVPECWKALD